MKALRAALGSLLMSLAVPGTALAQDTGKVVLGWAANLQTAPIVVAVEKGYFKDAGLEVKSVRFVTGREALEALLGGQLDLGFMAEFPPVIGALRNQNFRVVATLSKYAGNRIISKASVGFHDIKDLEGKRIGTTLGSNNDYFTQLVLKKYHVNATVVNVAPRILFLRSFVAISTPAYHSRISTKRRERRLAATIATWSARITSPGLLSRPLRAC